MGGRDLIPGATCSISRWVSQGQSSLEGCHPSCPPCPQELLYLSCLPEAQALCRAPRGFAASPLLQHKPLCSVPAAGAPGGASTTWLPRCREASPPPAGALPGGHVTLRSCPHLCISLEKTFDSFSLVCDSPKLQSCKTWESFAWDRSLPLTPGVQPHRSPRSPPPSRECWHVPSAQCLQETQTDQ